MGIDIYAHWKNQTPKQKQEQMTGFSTAHGHVGYLREAYHGNPYATHYMFQEVFAKKGEAKIPAKILRERLPRTLELVEERERRIYKQMRSKQIDRIKKSFVDFVKLCEQKEKQTKESCTIVADY
ncbi:MAG: hypothetical protein WC238_00185 [Parcubacteria group bacterium]|jgi:hypothetical protein